MDVYKFICDEGKIAFIQPFIYPEKNNFWDECFGEYTDEEFKNRFANDNQARNGYYLYGKTNLKKKLSNHPFFKEIECHYPCCYKSSKCSDNEYGGKFLCNGHDISNKFHDDSSQESQQAAIYLGNYLISYQLIDSKGFDFGIDVILTINNKEHFGCLIFNINVSSFTNRGLFDKKEFKLDAIIFLKHLFYKKRLKVSVNKYFNEKISLQQWNANYVKALFKTLNIEGYNNPIGTYKTIDYSILELNNIKDTNNILLEVYNIEDFKNKYANQLYGLLVSDEGWQYVPALHLSRRFSNNYFSTRNHTCTFIIGHNALIINQTCNNSSIELKKYGIEWFKKYHHPVSFKYDDFFKFRPCIPGLENHLFQVFIHSAYKNYRLEHTIETIKKIEDSNLQGLENTLKDLTNILETHAMNMGEIREAEDYVEKEFGISERIIDLQKKYEYRINQLKSTYDKQQDRSINILTIATILVSIVLAILSSVFNDESDWDKFNGWKYMFIGIILFILVLVVVIKYQEISNFVSKFKGKKEKN